MEGGGVGETFFIIMWRGIKMHLESVVSVWVWYTVRDVGTTEYISWITIDKWEIFSKMEILSSKFSHLKFRFFHFDFDYFCWKCLLFRFFIFVIWIEISRQYCGWYYFWNIDTFAHSRNIAGSTLLIWVGHLDSHWNTFHFEEDCA